LVVRGRVNYWSMVRNLFEVNDGSLPDIFVEDLTQTEIIEIYEWLMSQAQIARDPTAWSPSENRDIPLREIENPIRAYFAGSIESVFHCLSGLSINGVLLPELSVMIEPTAVSFDYRMGPEWREPELLALFHMLRSILRIAPSARIFHAHEGLSASPNVEFSEAFNLYVTRSSP